MRLSKRLSSCFPLKEMIRRCSPKTLKICSSTSRLASCYCLKILLIFSCPKLSPWGFSGGIWGYLRTVFSSTRPMKLLLPEAMTLLTPRGYQAYIIISGSGISMIRGILAIASLSSLVLGFRGNSKAARRHTRIYVPQEKVFLLF
jgi:hypothetical protein